MEEMINELKMKLLINVFCQEIEKFLINVKEKVAADEKLDEKDFVKIAAINKIVGDEANKLVETDEQKAIISSIGFTLDLVGLAILHDLRNDEYSENSRIETVLYLLKKVSGELNKLMETYKKEVA